MSRLVARLGFGSPMESAEWDRSAAGLGCADTLAPVIVDGSGLTLGVVSFLAPADVDQDAPRMGIGCRMVLAKFSGVTGVGIDTSMAGGICVVVIRAPLLDR